MSRFDSPIQVLGLFLIASLVSIGLIFLINAEQESRQHSKENFIKVLDKPEIGAPSRHRMTRENNLKESSSSVGGEEKLSNDPHHNSLLNYFREGVVKLFWRTFGPGTKQSKSTTTTSSSFKVVKVDDGEEEKVESDNDRKWSDGGISGESQEKTLKRIKRSSNSGKSSSTYNHNNYGEMNSENWSEDGSSSPYKNLGKPFVPQSVPSSSNSGSNSVHHKIRHAMKKLGGGGLDGDVVLRMLMDPNPLPPETHHYHTTHNNHGGPSNNPGWTINEGDSSYKHKLLDQQHQQQYEHPKPHEDFHDENQRKLGSKYIGKPERKLSEPSGRQMEENERVKTNEGLDEFRERKNSPNPSFLPSSASNPDNSPHRPKEERQYNYNHDHNNHHNRELSPTEKMMKNKKPLFLLTSQPLPAEETGESKELMEETIENDDNSSSYDSSEKESSNNNDDDTEPEDEESLLHGLGPGNPLVGLHSNETAPTTPTNHNSSQHHNKSILMQNLDICYKTDDVLVVIAITCCLNFAFVLVIWICVRWCTISSPKDKDFQQLDCEEGIDSIDYPQDPENIFWETNPKCLSSNCQIKRRAAHEATNHSNGGYPGGLATTTTSLYSFRPDNVPQPIIKRSYSYSMEDLRYDVTT